jgi:hypothetical protein
MITARTLNIFGIISIAFMTLCVVLVWLRLVPRWVDFALFILALSLFVTRLILRIKLLREGRKASAEPTPLKKS